MSKILTIVMNYSRRLAQKRNLAWIKLSQPISTKRGARVLAAVI